MGGYLTVMTFGRQL